MKTLPTHFTVRNNNFDLIREEYPVKMYHKTAANGAHRCYEIIITKVTKAGTTGRGGYVYSEDTEVYPGNELFGKIAYCEILEDRADRRFDQLLKRVHANDIEFDQSDDSVTITNEDSDDDVIEDTITPVDAADKVETGEKRGRKRKFDTSLVVFPDGNFTMKDLLSINPTFNQPILYNYIQSLIDLNKIKNEGTVKSNTRGKPAVIYSKINQ